MLLQYLIEVCLRLLARVDGVLDSCLGVLVGVFVLFLRHHVGIGELLLTDVHLCHLSVGNLGAFGVDVRPERALVHLGTLFLRPGRVKFSCPLLNVALQFIVVLVWG